MPLSGVNSAPARRVVLKLLALHETQRQVSECRSRYIVAAWGRQAGKSTYAINHIIRSAWINPGGVYWFISPTYKQAKIIFRRMKKALRCLPKSRVKFNKSELSIEFSHGSIIACQSGKEYDNLRTETLNGCVIDEVREQHPDLWTMVIRPMLSTTGGWCLFVSTPNGFDAFYDLAEFAKTDLTKQWSFFHAPSTCNPKFTEKEAAEMRSQMSEAQYEQEVLALFRNIHTGKAYKSEGEHNRRDTSPFSFDGGLVSPYLPVVVGMDFNVNPMSWHLGQNRNRDWYWFDEIHVENTNTSECALELVARLLELKEKELLRSKPQVILIGDSTGESRNTKATKSDYNIITEALDQAGVTWENQTPESNPPVKERVNTMNGVLKAADGSVHFWYHPKLCPKLKRDLERVSWKKGAQSLLDQKTDPMLTHASDSVGYPVCVLTPIDVRGAVGTMKVIRR